VTNTSNTFDASALVAGLRQFIRALPLSHADKGIVLSTLENSTKFLHLSRNSKQREYDRQRRAAGLVPPLTPAQRIKATAYMRKWRAAAKARRAALKAAPASQQSQIVRLLRQRA
jgi:hypothetical protein